VQINPCNQWATGSEPRAPDDLDRVTPLNDPAPPEGYSVTLYDFIYTVVEHVALYNPDLVSHLRFVNEPYLEKNWNVTALTYEQDVEDYIRCLRTAYLAAHQAADDNNVTIKVSYGGLNYNRQLEREWFRAGDASPALRPCILEQVQSRYERHLSEEFTWLGFKRWVHYYEVLPNCYWCDMLAAQSEWVDCFEVHYHFKPRFIYAELGAFEHMVTEFGGTLKPWFAGEAAMQLSPDGTTTFEERFHAGDMVRKWFTGMAFGLEGICTPIIGYPPDCFFGLYDVDANEYLAAECYRIMRRLVPNPRQFKNISKDPINTYRFRWNRSLVDIVWVDRLWDYDVSTELYDPIRPNNFRVGIVTDIFGQEMERIFPGDKLPIVISQEPVVMVWKFLEIPPPDYTGSSKTSQTPDRGP
jgi:hypothetical protein